MLGWCLVLSITKKAISYSLVLGQQPFRQPGNKRKLGYNPITFTVTKWAFFAMFLILYILSIKSSKFLIYDQLLCMMGFRWLSRNSDALFYACYNLKWQVAPVYNIIFYVFQTESTIFLNYMPFCTCSYNCFSASRR